MTKDSELRELLAPMIEREVSLDAPELQVDRARVLARMAEAGRRESARSRAWYALPILAAAAALLLVLAGRTGRSDGSVVALDVVITRGSATQSPAGELETAAASQARVSLKDGLQIELRDRTHVGLGELRRGGSQLTLAAGAVRCSVPHRTAEHAFRVVTPNATVLDLGTVFTVSIDDATHETRVSVEEGEVMIRTSAGETRLVAPNRWSSAVPEPEPAASDAPAPSTRAEEPARPNAPRAPNSTGSKPPRTSLAHEAQLLRQGLTAERQGRPAEAVAMLKQLLSENPSSPLAPDARAALARVEAQLH